VTPFARRLAALVSAALLALPAAAGAAPRPYAATPGPYAAHPRFAVSYQGTGTWRTHFHATPPNPGGAPDTNDARDASEYSWLLGYEGALALAGGATSGLDAARGRMLVIGHVDHVHVDGLYRELDSSVRCTLKGATDRSRVVPASIGVRYLGASGYAFTAGSPLATTLTEMPSACPDQGDSIDGILDNYFTPGFGFGPVDPADRWMASAAVTVPARVLHRSATVAIALRDTRAGRPPGDCAVANPAYERCATGGSWSGTLTLRRMIR
jgi:hypothetical protein